MTAPRTLTFKASLSAPAAEVYRAFTSSTALREWLCDAAQAEARPGGRLYLGWESGYYACGEFVSLLPEAKVVFTWFGKNEPAATRVQVALRPKGDRVLLSLIHSEVGSGARWRYARAAIENGWNAALENLRAVLETGQDLRLTRRPMLGIRGGDDLSDERATQLGVPVTRGLRIDDLVEGLGAQQAGLQKDDVIVKLGAKKITCFADLHGLLHQHQAGERLPLVFYRGGQRRKTVIELSARSHPPVPDTPAALAEATRQEYLIRQAELEQCLSGRTPAAASARSAPAAWNVLETLAHLVLTERSLQDWITDLATGEERWYDRWGGNLAAHNQALVQVYPTLSALLTTLKNTQAETVALLAALPPAFVARRGSYWRLATQLPLWTTHIREHLEQMKAGLAAQRQA